MEIIKSVLTGALQNMAFAVLLCFCLSLLYLFNIILGTIIGTKENNFNAKKFFFGFLKAICVLLVILGVCYILNVFVLTTNMIGSININIEFVGIIEMFTILVTNCIDLAKEIEEKVKHIRDLKWVDYESVISDTNVDDPTFLKG